MNYPSSLIDKMSSINPEVLAALKAVNPDLVNDVLEIQEEQKPHLLKWLDKFITKHPDMEQLKRCIRIVAPYDDPVLITGETGTGKELLANALHCNRTGRFVPVNCAGLPEHLIESELFGHVRGSFTGANTDRTGMMAAAENGTLFLDEVGELPLALQAKLLRSLQEKRIRQVGSNEEKAINCRLVSATHHNLKELVEDKLFREDLFWRISTVELKTLPLRLRSSDVPILVEFYDKDKDIKDVPKFCGCIDVKTQLTGNVRSLQQLVRRYQLFNILPDQELLKAKI